MTSIDIGQQHEALALDYLKRHKLRLLAQNYRCKLGEIDLIMTNKQREIIFVEVRYRAQTSHGGAVASVTHSKQQKIIRTAQSFLQHKKLYDRVCRFDVVAIELQNGKPAINWLQNAFSC